MVRPRSRAARLVQRPTAGACLAYSAGTAACTCAGACSTCGGFSFGSCADVVAGTSAAARLTSNAEPALVGARNRLFIMSPPLWERPNGSVPPGHTSPDRPGSVRARERRGLDQKYGVKQKERW